MKLNGIHIQGAKLTQLSTAPTITYATWDPTFAVAAIYSNGNLTVINNSHNIQNGAAVASKALQSTGKWYWEVETIPSATVGIANSTPIVSGTSDGIVGNSWIHSFGFSSSLGSIRYLNLSQGWPGITVNTEVSFGITYANDVLMFACDMDNGALYIGANGSWGTAVPTSGATKTGAIGTGLSGTVYPAASMSTAADLGYGTSGESVVANFGQTAFKYSVPAGYNSGVY